MRRVLTALFYLAMICGGAYLCWGWLDVGGTKIGPLAGGSLLIFGCYLLWLDFFSAERLTRDR